MDHFKTQSKQSLSTIGAFQGPPIFDTIACHSILLKDLLRPDFLVIDDLSKTW
jgi:hypothetical protein